MTEHDRVVTGSIDRYRGGEKEVWVWWAFQQGFWQFPVLAGFS